MATSVNDKWMRRKGYPWISQQAPPKALSSAFRLHKQFNDVGVVACNFQDLFNKTFTVMLCTLGSSLTHSNAVSPMSPFSKRNQKLTTLFFFNNTRRSPVPLPSWHTLLGTHAIRSIKVTKLVVLNVLRAVRMIGAFFPQRNMWLIYCTILCQSNLDNHLRLLIFSIFFFKFHTSWNGAEFHPSKAWSHVPSLWFHWEGRHHHPTTQHLVHEDVIGASAILSMSTM